MEPFEGEVVRERLPPLEPTQRRMPIWSAALLKERVPIRDLVRILEATTAVAGPNTDSDLLVEAARPIAEFNKEFKGNTVNLPSHWIFPKSVTFFTWIISGFC